MEKLGALVPGETKIEGLTPKEIVVALDKYIIGQNQAKRAVAVALRNRTRRKMLDPDLRDEVLPKNIILMGPTGVGKTEIARRLSKLAQAPFIKVEASKYTEVGYVGRDVESMIRDLVDVAVNNIRQEHQVQVTKKAGEQVEERLLDLLVPPSPLAPEDVSQPDFYAPADGQTEMIPAEAEKEEAPTGKRQRTREIFREKLSKGELEDKEVDVELEESGGMEVFFAPGMEGLDSFNDVISKMMPRKTHTRKMKISEARPLLIQEEINHLIDMDAVTKEAVERVQDSGIIFIDELDKIAGRESSHGPDVSREGVQRDILPIVEGSTVNTKFGSVKTDHILFIAAGAFHVAKPSDLIPELQGRFPIRVELSNLDVEDFKRILTEPKNALTIQYIALLGTEGLKISFTTDAIDAIASFAFQVNEGTENIGARRLHTIMEKLFEIISFDAPDMAGQSIKIDAAYVQERLADVARDMDLSKYIL